MHLAYADCSHHPETPALSQQVNVTSETQPLLGWQVNHFRDLRLKFIFNADTI